MLVVKTKLKEIEGKGISLFSNQQIKKDGLVYQFDPKIDLFFEFEDIPNCAPLVAFLEKHAISINKTSCVINADYTKFINHSKTPNTRVIKNDKVILELRANRNIKKNEELTMNYYTVEEKLNFVPLEDKDFNLTALPF